jgi:hypothetical protein
MTFSNLYFTNLDHDFRTGIWTGNYPQHIRGLTIVNAYFPPRIHSSLQRRKKNQIPDTDGIKKMWEDLKQSKAKSSINSRLHSSNNLCCLI